MNNKSKPVTTKTRTQVDYIDYKISTNLVSICKPSKTTLPNKKTSSLVVKHLAKQIKFKRKWKSIASVLKSIFCSPCLVQRDFKFKLSSYNILAPTLAADHTYLYNNVLPKYLDWNYRRDKIMSEIKHASHDIYCFQEMEETQYYEYFYPKLKALGYECLYKKRLGDKVDGLAIIFKRHKFQLVKHEFIEFFMPNVDLLNKDNIAIVALLKPKYGPIEQKLCVATTHLLFSPKRGDIKLAQMQMLLANLDRLAFKECVEISDESKGGSAFETKYYPIILCGDMNSTYKSNIYKFIVNSRLNDYQTLNRATLSGQCTRERAADQRVNMPLLPQHVDITDQSQFKQVLDERVKIYDTPAKFSFGEACLTHNFKFKSVYDHVDRVDGSEECTTCLPQNHQTVDYIFYTHAKGSLKLLSRLELFNQTYLRDSSLPDKHYPSDHFNLSAKFLLKNDE